MGDPNPPNPPNPPANQDAEFQRFSDWLDRYTREHETGGIPPRSGGQQSPSTSSTQPDPQSISQAVEAALAAREKRQQQATRLQSLEASNTELKQELDKIKEQLKKPAKSVFSLFS